MSGFVSLWRKNKWKVWGFPSWQLRTTIGCLSKPISVVGSEQGQGEWRSTCGFVWTREFVQNWKSPRKNQRIEKLWKSSRAISMGSKARGAGSGLQLFTELAGHQLLQLQWVEWEDIQSLTWEHSQSEQNSRLFWYKCMCSWCSERTPDKEDRWCQDEYDWMLNSNCRRWKERRRQRSPLLIGGIVSAIWCPGWQGGFWKSVIDICFWDYKHTHQFIYLFQGLGRGLSTFYCMLGWVFGVWNQVLFHWMEPVCLVLLESSTIDNYLLFLWGANSMPSKFRTRLIWIKFCQWRGGLGSLVLILKLLNTSPPFPSWSSSCPSQ